MDKLICVEVITMAKPNNSQSGTNIQQVRQQNAQSASAGSQGQFGTEFGSETDVQKVKQANQQAEAKKSQGSGQAGQS